MRRILFAIFIGLGGALILISLGVWQVQRLNWKQDLLGRIEAQISGDPIPLATALEQEAARYSPVTVTGAFLPGHLRILASRKQTGAVYRIVRPFEAKGLGPILVDTGWQLDDADVAPRPEGQVTLKANLDKPNEIDSFTPDPDRTNNVWFARDVDAMAKELQTQPVFVVLRDAPDTPLGVTPWPVDTAGIPNDHLQYAITWFSLAAIWIGMSLYFISRKRPLQTEPDRP